jgi:hypothetical protein
MRANVSVLILVYICAEAKEVKRREEQLPSISVLILLLRYTCPKAEELKCREEQLPIYLSS